MSDDELINENVKAVTLIIDKYSKKAWKESSQLDIPFAAFSILLIKRGIDSMASAHKDEWSKDSICDIKKIITGYYDKSFSRVSAPTGHNQPPKLELVKNI